MGESFGFIGLTNHCQCKKRCWLEVDNDISDKCFKVSLRPCVFCRPVWAKAVERERKFASSHMSPKLINGKVWIHVGSVSGGGYQKLPEKGHRRTVPQRPPGAGPAIHTKADGRRGI